MKDLIKIVLCAAMMFLISQSIHCQTRSFDGDTQTDMNINAGEDYSKWNEKMHKVLSEAAAKHKEDKLFVANLKKSQKLWETWRDAEIETFYPEYKDSKEVYGSMQPLCRYSKLIDWTEQRIRQLEIYSKGVESDDACGPGRM